MAYVYVDIADFGIDTLIEHLENRGYTVTDDKDVYQESKQFKDIVERIWYNQRVGRPIDANIKELVYLVLGRIV